MYYLTKDETIKNTRMLTLLIKDPWTYIASLGTAFFLSINWIAENLTPIASFIGALVGLAVLVVGLRSKLRENNNMEQERINLKLDEEIKRLEIERLKRNQ